jgi:nucleoside-diphosphate-sugar epimerase
MNILVLGATGYIGSSAARALQARGHRVTGLARSDAAAARLEAAGLGVARGDMTDGVAVERAARLADGVVNAAFDRDDIASAMQISVAALLEALRGSDKPLVQCGGTLIYGDTADGVVAEDEPRTPPPFVTWAPLEAAVIGARADGVRSVMVRSPLLYGHGGGAMLPGFIAASRQWGVGVHIGDGSNRWSATHIDDVGDLVARAVEQAEAGSVFVPASGQTPSLEEIAISISRLIGAGGRTQSWPVAEAAAAMGDWAYGIVMNQRFSTRAGEMLGWQPTGPSIEDDIERGSYVTT